MMPYIDIPEPLQERVVCSIMAAIKYEVPANIVLAVAEKEGGKPGQWSENQNGTFDVGPMQFNTLYLSDLKKYGITAEDVAESGCYSYDLAAWRLRGHLQHDQGTLWVRAANYHSRTPKYNEVYREDLVKKAQKWGSWLEVRFTTYSVTTPGVAPVRASLVAKNTKEIPKAPIKPRARHYKSAKDALMAVYGPAKTELM